MVLVVYFFSQSIHYQEQRKRLSDIPLNLILLNLFVSMCISFCIMCGSDRFVFLLFVYMIITARCLNVNTLSLSHSCFALLRGTGTTLRQCALRNELLSWKLPIWKRPRNSTQKYKFS